MFTCFSTWRLKPKDILQKREELYQKLLQKIIKEILKKLIYNGDSGKVEIIYEQFVDLTILKEKIKDYFLNDQFVVDNILVSKRYDYNNILLLVVQYDIKSQNLPPKYSRC